MKRTPWIAIGFALGLLLGGVAYAARDSAGTYSRPAGWPVVTGTPISSSHMNAYTADVASEITDSLSRSGKGPMLAPLKLYSGGNATTPELVWNDDTNSGFYLIGNDNIGLSLGGTKRCEWTTSALDCAGLEATFDAVTATTITGSLGADVVVTASITDGAVTRAKLAAVGQQISGSSGSFSTSSGTPVDVTNLSVTITTTGRPVLVFLQPDGTAGGSTIRADATSAGATAIVSLVRDSTTIGYFATVIETGTTYISVPASSVHMIDAPGAGTYTYKAQASAAVGTTHVFNAKLVALEL